MTSRCVDEWHVESSVRYPISEYDEDADEHSEDARGKVVCHKNLGCA